MEDYLVPCFRVTLLGHAARSHVVPVPHLGKQQNSTTECEFDSPAHDVTMSVGKLGLMHTELRFKFKEKEIWIS